MVNANNTITIDNKKVKIGEDKNLLELIRRSGIELPTFCYHSELSVYGACRLCIVEIEGRGVQASCSIVPEPGMVVRTSTKDLRDMRKIYLQLLLANHHKRCTTCSKSSFCKLQDLANRLGVDDIPFKAELPEHEIDNTSPSLVRDSNKCVLCGDCVRACSEIQGIGAIDFVNRGSETVVAPAFNKNLDKVECVYCGLCASVCPTGAITPKSDIDKVWSALDNKGLKVVAQIAPAVRVALGEMFGLEAGTITTGSMVAAIKMLGFDKVFDTSFGADLTVLEEATEFIGRKLKGERLPLFTSCCPGWVKYAEQYYPEILDNLSSCRSPQQMFGSVAKDTLPKYFGVEPKDVYVVSIMPCTAKKFEAGRDEFEIDGVRDVDAVITTQELGKMIKEAGINFNELKAESLDLPLGFKTGAGVIFGATGGVSEAVLRYATEKITGETLDDVDFHEVRGLENVRDYNTTIGGIDLKIAIVHGLANAKKLAEEVKAGRCEYDLIEVMACPGGCISGAGQPVSWDPDARQKRADGLYENDKQLQLHKSQDNPYLVKTYQENLGEIGGHKAHKILHTKYEPRKRFEEQKINILGDADTSQINVGVCVGTGCDLNNSQDLMTHIVDYVQSNGLEDKVSIQATFNFEGTKYAARVQVGDKVMKECSEDQVLEELKNQLG